MEQTEHHISRFFDCLNTWTPLHRPDEGASTEARINRIQSNDVLDVKYGFDRYKDSVDRLGWLVNMHPVRKTDFCWQLSYRRLSCMKKMFPLIWVTNDISDDDDDNNNDNNNNF